VTDFFPENDISNNTVTFRIQRDIIDGLSQGLKYKSDKNVELIINQILRSYVVWYNPASQGGTIPFSKWLISRIFNNLSDQQMDTIAKENVEYDVKGQMYMCGRQYNMASILNFICDWCKASGFPYRHDADNGNDICVLRFDLGQNWPVFSAKFIRKIAEHLGEEKKLDIEVMSKTLIVKMQR
jgi:hypothetical protein